MPDRPIVLESIETPNGDRCVDFFRHDNGTFGFEEYRRDFEDPSGWFPIGQHRFVRFPGEKQARDAAHAKISWLENTTNN
jgi:hypothetical protein